MVKEVKITLRNAGKINPESIDDYIKAGGYRALEKARLMDQEDLIDEIENIGKLRGRGGAGFKTGFKWKEVYKASGDIKYIVCNGEEGYRGEPRLKPPFPTVAGYLGKPTVVNNVETFATVPVIAEKGADWFAGICVPEYPGTKLFCLAGAVKNRGIYELPSDAKLSDLILDCGGGPLEGHSIKAIQMGGGSCGSLLPEQMDVQLNFDSMRAMGASLGSGAVLVLDETHNMAEFAKGSRGLKALILKAHARSVRCHTRNCWNCARCCVPPSGACTLTWVSLWGDIIRCRVACRIFSCA